MVAIIGAMGRLTGAGMTEVDATDTVLRIMHEPIAHIPSDPRLGMRREGVATPPGGPSAGRRPMPGEISDDRPEPSHGRAVAGGHTRSRPSSF